MGIYSQALSLSKIYFSNEESNFFLVSFLFTIIAFSQNLIEGKVTDFNDHTAIPYVSISLKEDNTGSATNTGGHFILSVISFPVTLIFSHVNYGRTEQTFRVATPNAEVTLNSLPIELPEVNVSASDPVQIVNNVYGKLIASKSKVIANGFYRQWTRNDDLYSELIESFYTSKISATGVEQSAITQGRYARTINKANGLVANKNFSIFTNTFPLAMTRERSFLSPVCEDVEKYFSLKLSEKIKEKNGKIIYVISFVPKVTNATPGFNGKLFIDEEYNLIRFNGSINDTKFNPVEIDPSKISNVKLEIDAFCDNKVEGVLLLENLKTDLYYTYKYDDKNSRQIHSSSFYFVYKFETNNLDRELAVNKSSSDYEAIHNPQYDESFWDKKYVLSQTPVEKDIVKQFRKSKEFKKVFLQ